MNETAPENTCMKRMFVAGAVLLAFASLAHADPTDWVAYQQPVVAFTHATIVDGTGAAPKLDQTLVIDKGRISELGPAGSTKVPAGATVIDAHGKTLLPGFVMMHEHLFYPTRLSPSAFYTAMPHSFRPLYLAGGETTIRTTGAMMPYAYFNVRDDSGIRKRGGPVIYVTVAYLQSGSPYIEYMHVL